MTVEELYGQVMADESLRAEMHIAVAAGKVVEWAAARGVNASEGELLDFLQMNAEGVELTDEQLEKVAGGGASEDYGIYVDAVFG